LRGFERNGEWLLKNSISEKWSKKLLLSTCSDAAVSALTANQCPGQQKHEAHGETPLLVIADRGNRSIQTFTLDGAHLRTIKDQAHLRMPCNFQTQGEWMVCPDLDSQVCILDRQFNVVAQLGDGKAENGEVGSRRSQ
jgi:hypothetical protein